MDKEVHSFRKAECEQNRMIHKIWEDPMAARDVGCTLGILLCPFFFGGDWGRKMLGAKPRVMWLLSRCSDLWPQPPAFLLGLFPHLTDLWEFIVFNLSVNSGVTIVVLWFSSPLFPVGRQRLWMHILLLHQAFLLSSSCPDSTMLLEEKVYVGTDSY